MPEDGSPPPIKPGPHGAPRELPGSSIAGDILLTPRGTLGLRGPMIPVAAYAPSSPPSGALSRGRPLRATIAAGRLPDRGPAARLRRYRLRRAAGSHDRSDQHHLAAL